MWPSLLLKVLLSYCFMLYTTLPFHLHLANLIFYFFPLAHSVPGTLVLLSLKSTKLPQGLYLSFFLLEYTPLGTKLEPLLLSGLCLNVLFSVRSFLTPSPYKTDSSPTPILLYCTPQFLLPSLMSYNYSSIVSFSLFLSLMGFPCPHILWRRKMSYVLH